MRREKWAGTGGGGRNTDDANACLRAYNRELRGTTASKARKRSKGTHTSANLPLFHVFAHGFLSAHDRSLHCLGVLRRRKQRIHETKPLRDPGRCPSGLPHPPLPVSSTEVHPGACARSSDTEGKAQQKPPNERKKHVLVQRNPSGPEIPGRTFRTAKRSRRQLLSAVATAPQSTLFLGPSGKTTSTRSVCGVVAILWAPLCSA